MVGVCEQRAAVGGQRVYVDRFKTADLFQIAKEQGRQPRSAGSVEIGFGCLRGGAGHRAGTARGRRGRSAATSCSSTVAIKWWARRRKASGERLSATFLASR